MFESPGYFYEGPPLNTGVLCVRRIYSLWVSFQRTFCSGDFVLFGGRNFLWLALFSLL